VLVSSGSVGTVSVNSLVRFSLVFRIGRGVPWRTWDVVGELRHRVINFRKMLASVLSKSYTAIPNMWKPLLFSIPVCLCATSFLGDVAVLCKTCRGGFHRLFLRSAMNWKRWSGHWWPAIHLNQTELPYLYYCPIFWLKCLVSPRDAIFGPHPCTPSAGLDDRNRLRLGLSFRAGVLSDCARHTKGRPH
jgi:hypothetical protein